MADNWSKMIVKPLKYIDFSQVILKNQQNADLKWKTAK